MVDKIKQRIEKILNKYWEGAGKKGIILEVPVDLATQILKELREDIKKEERKNFKILLEDIIVFLKTGKKEEQVRTEIKKIILNYER